MLQHIPAGFARPVFESQSTFRAVLQAMSNPGRPVSVPVRAQGPSGWSGTMAAVVLTLCDMDTPLWLDPEAASSEALRFLRFHCGSPVTDMPRAASFGIILNPNAMPALEEFSSGDAEYPELHDHPAGRALTGPAERLARIHGPGIAGTVELPNWLPRGFTEQWTRNGELFPRGVDVILAAPNAIVGLPRTLKVEEKPCM
jgi:alpha-D-ribose 1-methylphosphonate 5-triphosphate synthase subunit PhnH